jgi:hypothetical protein
MDINNLVDEIKLWMVYEWDEPERSSRRTVLIGLLFNLSQASENKPTWEPASKSLGDILRNYQELPEHIKNLIFLYCL